MLHTWYKEGIMGISSWMLLRLKQGIKVPKAALYVVIGWHFWEAHLQEYLSELRSDLEQWMKVTTRWHDSKSIKVVVFEGFILPRPTGKNDRLGKYK